MIIGGLDIGTTGCKIALYNNNKQLLETYYHEYNTTHQNGCHEISFSDVKTGVFSLLKQALSNYKIDALGVTSFGETFAMLDENDNILAPSMLYTDPRGKEECEYISKTFGEEWLTLTTGVKPHPMYSIYKILWLKNNNPDAFGKCKRILLGEDFIVYTLTGVAQIDFSLAARTGAFDIENKCWIEDSFKALDIDVKLMSRVAPSGAVAGVITAAVKKELGVDYDITVVNGCHDLVAAMIGSGVFVCEQAMDGTGTVECIPVVLDKKPADLSFYDGGYSVVPYLNDKYACYALSFTGGATLKWFRDNFAELEYQKSIEDKTNVYAELDAKLTNEPSGLLIMPHFAGAATPYMDDSSKAAFIGITLETTKMDIYKALMEGTSFEMLLNFNTLNLADKISEVKATGGGATSDVWLQIKADILNTDITALDCKEVGAAGTVALTGIAMGCYSDIGDTVNQMVSVRKVFTPDKANHLKYMELYNKYVNIYSAVKGL